MIRGTNFEPFEAVSLTIRRADVEPFRFINAGTAAEWVAIADEKGRIETTWLVNYPGTRFVAEATSGLSKYKTSADFAILAGSANLDQCRNGPLDSPADCIGSNWVNGNLNASQAHYVEGESVPYRMRMADLTLAPHNLTIEFDSTESARHAIDYLTTFDRTELTADPCSDITGCNPAVFSTIPIPLDPEVTKGPDGVLGTGDDVTQIPGDFVLYGGTITSVSAYTLDGTYAGSSKTRITISFTASVANPVLAWGGHIATRQDWGANNSAIAINGSPYHMRLYDLDGSGGNQDRSLQSAAVYYPGRITIIKDAQPDTALPFGFTAVGPSVFNFTIDDDGDNTNTYSNTQIFDGITNFGSGHTVTVTEDPSSGYWYLTQISCTSDPNGGSGTNNNSISLPAQQVEIFLEEGEYVTCTFVNAVVTAASISVSGRLVDNAGRGIPNAAVVMTPVYGGELRFARTGSFGYYRFDDVPAGDDCVISVYAKGYTFSNPSVMITPMEDMSNIDFTALPF